MPRLYPHPCPDPDCIDGEIKCYTARPDDEPKLRYCPTCAGSTEVWREYPVDGDEGEAVVSKVAA